MDGTRTLPIKKKGMKGSLTTHIPFIGNDIAFCTSAALLAIVSGWIWLRKILFHKYRIITATCRSCYCSGEKCRTYCSIHAVADWFRSMNSHFIIILLPLHSTPLNLHSQNPLYKTFHLIAISQSLTADVTQCKIQLRTRECLW